MKYIEKFEILNKGTSCTNNRCKICPRMKFDSIIRSNSTKYFTGLVHATDANCSSKYIVYCITCDKCGMQYVGETSRTLKQRFSSHNTSIKNEKTNTLLYSHFAKCQRNEEKRYSIHILDDHDDNISTRIRLEKELFWIKLLNTAFPIGLNDKIKGFGNISGNKTNLLESKNQPYFALKIHAPAKNRGKRNKHRSPNNLVQNICSQSISYDEYRIMRNQCSIREIRQIHSKSQSTTMNSKKAQELNVLISSFMSNHAKQLSNNNIPKPKPKPPNCAIPYLHSVFEKHNIQRKIKSFLALNYDIPKDFLSFRYQLLTPISLKIFNYNCFLKSLSTVNIQQILTDKCSCHLFNNTALASDYYHDLDHGPHLLTGNTEILNENYPELQLIISKGTKFRIEPDIKTKFQLIKQFAQETSKYIARSFKFDETKINQIEKDLIALFPEPKSQIDNTRIFQQIKDIRSKFIITPIDKASNNYVFICPKIYVSFMNAEMGVKINNDNVEAIGNDTYHPYSQETTENIINRHEKITNLLRLSVDDDCDKVLPLIYGIPKLHKNPVKMRFITGAKTSSLKPISICLQKILKHLKTHFRRYCYSTSSYNSGYSYYWSIDNSTDLVKQITHNREAKMFVADFSNLFTNLPHTLIIMYMNQLIDLLFSNSGNDNIRLFFNRCTYTDIQGPNTFSKSDVKFMISYILNNSYTSYANVTYKQVKGVPQGNNASPLIADLTLSMIEFLYSKNNPHSILRKTIRSRYMDDIIIFYDSDNQFQEFVNIYPPELTLNRTNTSDTQGEYLDLFIYKESNEWVTKLYNKTEAYQFDVIRFPYFSSTIPQSIKQGCIPGELIRIIRCVTYRKEFENRVSHLNQLLIKNKYPHDVIFKMIHKTISSRSDIMLKYSLPSSSTNKKSWLQNILY